MHAAPQSFDKWLEEIHAAPKAVQALARAKARAWMQEWGGKHDPIEFVGHTASYLKSSRADIAAIRKSPRSDRAAIARALLAREAF